jgi:hypothetical protein
VRTRLNGGSHRAQAVVMIQTGIAAGPGESPQSLMRPF